MPQIFIIITFYLLFLQIMYYKYYYAFQFWDINWKFALLYILNISNQFFSSIKLQLRDHIRYNSPSNDVIRLYLQKSLYV